MPKIIDALNFMLKIANDDSHGYDQTNRNGGVDYDCSSLVATALHEAGFNVNPASYTGNIRKQLLNCGFKSISVKESRKAGDIFLTENKHIVMCVDANTIVHASINEKGTTTGGKEGDQTGKEICTRTFYTPSYGWQYHLRYEDTSTTATTTSTNNATIKTVKAEKSAKSFDKTIAGEYKVTADVLNVRNGAGVSNKILTKITEGTKVRNYGYYTTVSGIKWLYVTFTKDSTNYIGFVSSEYLTK